MKNPKSISITILFILLISCVSQESKWEETKKANSINIYEAFITEFPKSKHMNEAKTSISNILLEKLKSKLLKDGNNQEDGYNIIEWNGKLFDKILCSYVSYNGTMGIDGNLVPIPGESYYELEMYESYNSPKDSTFYMKCVFTKDSKIKVSEVKFAENTIIKMNNGDIYRYKNGIFEK
jgi:hypothetical protein